MQDLQRRFISIALALILLSSIGGGLFAFSVEQTTLLNLREQYAAAFMAAARDDLATAGEFLRQAQALNYRYVRIIDAHTHLIKLAGLLLLIGFVMLFLNWNVRRQSRFAIVLSCGVVAFPAGVYLQTIVNGALFQGIAALGALLIIGCTGALVIALFQNPDSKKPA